MPRTCPYPDCSGEIRKAHHLSDEKCNACGRRPEYAPEDPLAP